MSKFKVGDKVRRIDDKNNRLPVGTIGTVKDINKLSLVLEEYPYLTLNPKYFELVEEPIKATEIKIDCNRIKFNIPKANIENLQTSIIDFEEEVKKQLFEKFNKKEGNKMIESMTLIDLYASKHKESIEKETKEKVEELRKKSSIRKQYDEITQRCIDDLNNLFVSQFSEEEREIMKEKMAGCSDCDKEMKRKTSCYEFGYYINEGFITDEIKELENEMVNKVEELNDLVKTVKAHVGIAKTKEEVEEILTRYGIIDKKGKLVIK